MKKYSLLVLFLASFLFGQGRSYVYDTHFPSQVPPWYFQSYGMGVDAQGRIYISSIGEVFVLSPSGEVLRTISVINPNTGVKYELENLWVDDENFFYGTVVVSNKGDQQLLKFDTQGRLVKGGPAGVMDVCIAPDGKIYVMKMMDAYGNVGLVVLDKDFNRIQAFEHIKGDDFWVDSQKIYVTVGFPEKVQVFNLAGEFQLEFSLVSLSSADIFVDDQGYIYISGGMESPYAITKYSPTGEYLGGWGEVGTEPGNFLYGPQAVYKHGKIYTNEYPFSRIRVFDTSGNFLKEMAANGTEPGKYYDPRHIEVSHDETLYVADTQNKRVQVLNKKGEVIRIIQGFFVRPVTLAVDDEENLYVGDVDWYSYDPGRIYKFNKKGELITSWPALGDGYYIHELYDLATDKDGYIYALDRDLPAIYKFTPEGGFVKKIELGYVSGPVSFDVDFQGQFHVVDLRDYMVFSPEGEKLLRVGFSWPNSIWDVAVGTQGKVFLASYFGFTPIFMLDDAGNIVETFGGESDLLRGLRAPASLAVAPNGNLFVLELWRIVRFRPKAGTPHMVSASASTPGAHDTYWKTDLSLFNPSDQAIQVALAFWERETQTTLSFSLQPAELLSFPDVLENLFQKPESFGAIVATTEDTPQLYLQSRTYTESLNGSFGVSLRGIPWEGLITSEEKGFFVGLKGGGDYHSNIGFVNPSEVPLTLGGELYDTEGAFLGEATWTLPSHSHQQVNNILDALGVSVSYAWMAIKSLTPGSPFLSYATVVDNRTGDSVYQLAQRFRGYSREGGRMVIPAFVSAPGAYGTHWKTEAFILNSHREPLTMEMVFHPEEGGELNWEVTLFPGEMRHYADLLGEVFGVFDGYGYGEVTSDGPGLILVFSVKTGEEGSFGQGVPVFYHEDIPSLGTQRYLFPLEEDEAFRSNLGLVNLGEEEKTFTLFLYHEGVLMDQKTVHLGPFSWRQLNQVILTSFYRQGKDYLIKIASDTPDYLAYATVIDNRTGDGVFYY